MFAKLSSLSTWLLVPLTATGRPGLPGIMPPANIYWSGPWVGFGAGGAMASPLEYLAYNAFTASINLYFDFWVNSPFALFAIEANASAISSSYLSLSSDSRANIFCSMFSFCLAFWDFLIAAAVLGGSLVLIFFSVGPVEPLLSSATSTTLSGSAADWLFSLPVPLAACLSGWQFETCLIKVKTACNVCIVTVYYDGFMISTYPRSTCIDSLTCAWTVH